MLSAGLLGNLPSSFHVITLLPYAHSFLNSHPQFNIALAFRQAIRGPFANKIYFSHHACWVSRSRLLAPRSLFLIDAGVISSPYPATQLHSRRLNTTSTIMGKKKTKGEYNDFLDGEKLRDNADVRTALSGSSIGTRDISPPQTRHGRRGRGKKDRGGPKKPQLTHFLCLPLVNEGTRPQFEEGLEKLKKELEEEEIIPVKAIRPPGTLHLTLGVMSLDENRLEEAREYLQELDLKALLRDITSTSLAQRTAEDGAPAENLMPDTESLSIAIHSLIPMQAAHKTSVLYGQPKGDSQRLQTFGEALRARFTEKGLLVEDKRPLKLHATIVNTIYAKSGGRRGKGGKGKGGSKYDDRSIGEPKDHEESVIVSLGQPTAEIETTLSGGKDKSSTTCDSDSWMRFDALSLVERYKGFVWARDVRIDTVQICKMGAKKIWSGEKEGEGEVVGEEYQVVASKLI